MISINEEKARMTEELLIYTKSKGIDLSFIIEVEYKKSEYYLKQMLFKSEKALLDYQNGDIVNDKRSTMIEQTYNQLSFILERFHQMDRRIKELESENQTLKDKFDFFKANRK